MPSSTRCGARLSSSASLALAGSDSPPLAMITVPAGLRSGPARRPAAATARILRPAGNPAPPRPVSPDSSTAVISASCSARAPPAGLNGGGP